MQRMLVSGGVLACCLAAVPVTMLAQSPIDRRALVARHRVVVREADPRPLP